MKFIVLLFLLFCFKAKNLLSQDSLINYRKKMFLSEQNFRLTPTEIIESFRLTEDSWINNPDDYTSSITKFQSAHNLDVVNYFSLNDSLNTELKRHVFYQSNQFKALSDSLLKIKSEYLKSIFYSRILLNGYIGSHIQTFDKDERSDDFIYDINNAGYFIKIGGVLPYHCDYFSCPKVLNGIEFKQLPIIKSYNLPNSKNSYTQYLYFPMLPEHAIVIENQIEDIEILTVFNIKDISTSTFSDNDFLTENKGKPCKVKVVKGGAFRLLVYNKFTQEIYIDKLYNE